MDAPVLCQRDLDALLEPYRDVLGPYADRLYVGTPPAGMEIVPAAAFVNGPTLVDVLRTAADRWRAPDLCVAASLWSKYYAAAVLPGLLAALALGVGLDGSLPRAGIGLRDGLPQALVIRDGSALLYTPRVPAALAGTLPGKRTALAEVQRSVIVGGFERHLRPVVEGLHSLTHLSRQILWSNVANLCAALYERLIESAALRAVVDGDRSLLDHRECPGLAGPNPLRGLVRYEPTVDSCGSRRVRQRCCLRYRLPDSTPCAGICPLKRPEPQAIEYGAG